MKRVLFVDDEAALLDGLRGRLRGLRSRWEMVFVESGSRAITEMEIQPADIIVTDMRMPSMDGVELLTHIRNRWPETTRIVLSGFAEQEQSARLLTLAHQYLSKPCDAQQIESVIDRCAQLHEVLKDARLRALVGRIKKLPAVPGTYVRLREAMTKPDVSLREIADIVHEDPAVAAKVLQVVNSAFFRLARRITRIDQAVNYLGLNAVRTLVASVEVFSAWQSGASIPGLEPEHLQDRARRVAAAARALAAGSPMVDDAMLAGLFHNIGYWVLLQDCQAELARACETARTENIALHEAQRRVIGTSYAEVGAYLLGLWGLPYAVVEAIAFQHDPQRVGQTQFDVLAVLVTAIKLTRADDDTSPLALEADAAMIDSYLQSLNAPFGWSEARQRISDNAGEWH